MTDTINRLLDAAEKRIRTSGYHAVSFRDLAMDLGIKSSSVHYYFRQKEDLGVALVHRYQKQFERALANISQDSIIQRLQAFCGLYRTSLVINDALCLCGMLGVESGGLPEPVVKAVQRFLQGNIDWVAQVLPAEIPLAERQSQAATLVAGLQGAMMLAVCMQDLSYFDQAVKHLLQPYLDSSSFLSR
jgi:TetR/AcrR family transcriptional regulator, transcriptional repressor for nem operon